jgi:hypothetical protein
LQGTFAEVVAKLERGETQLRWSNGLIMDVVKPPAGIGFELMYTAEHNVNEPAPSSVGSSVESHLYPCVDWY